MSLKVLKLRSGTKSSFLEFIRTSASLESWPSEVPINTVTGTGVVVGFMPLIRSQVPDKTETVEAFSKRILARLLNRLPKSTTELHIVADRYDGVFGLVNISGNPIVLKDSSGCHERRGNTVTKSFIVTKSMVLENWDILLMQSESKARIIEGIFELWIHVCLSELRFTIYLSGGFSDRMKVLKLVPSNMTVDPSPDCEANLCSTHEEADT